MVWCFIGWKLLSTLALTNPGRKFSRGSHSLNLLSTNIFPISNATAVLVMEAISYSVDSVAGAPELIFCIDMMKNAEQSWYK